MASTSFAEKLRSGERLLAASATISPVVAELIGHAGFDWLFIDAEAHPLTLPEILALIRASETTSAHPIVRTNNDDAADIRQILDMGADGVIIPLVKTAEQARRIVAAAKFPPLGHRGITAGRAQRYGYGSNPAKFLANANSGTAVIVMIEESVGLSNVADIAAVEGLDGIFVGPGDLCVSLGCPGEAMHARVRSAYETIAAAATAHNLALGTFPSGKDMYDVCFELGFRFFLTALDTDLIASAADSQLSEFRRW